MIIKCCKQCSGVFFSYPSDRRIFCSRICCNQNPERAKKLSLAILKRGNSKQEFSCQSCQKIMFGYPKWKKYCSRACFYSAHIPWNKNKKFPQISGQNSQYWTGIRMCLCGKLKVWAAKRCRNCHIRFAIGENAGNWQGGKLTLREAIKSSKEYKKWCIESLKRDHFICTNCKTRDSMLDVDHIKPFALIIHQNKIKTLEDAIKCPELWNLNNGRTLCRDCHKKTDTFGWKTMKLIYADIQSGARPQTI